MGFFDLFSKKTYEDYEKAGDDFFTNGILGPAKMEYEKALKKLKKESVQKESALERVRGKITKAKERLALQHKKTADELLGTGMADDAEDLLKLALELTADSELAEEIKKQLTRLNDQYVGDQEETLANVMQDDDDAPGNDEYFELLINVLPEDEQTWYRSLNEYFQLGYIALNQGDFQSALEFFSQAIEDNPDRTGYIRLEMATAHLHQGNLEEAENLLETVIREQPKLIRAYHVLCEIRWEEKNYDQALQLLESVPKSLNDTLAMNILKGETLFRSERFENARDHYDQSVQEFEYDEILTRGQAKTYEALGLYQEACDSYAQIMGACQGCGQHIDPVVKRGYANACLEIGEHSTSILEMFFELTREDPENRSEYYEKISKLYENQGKAEEAKRYQELALQESL